MTGKAGAYNPKKPLGIIAGVGELPALLIESHKEQGGEVFIVVLEGHTPEKLVDIHPHIKCRIGAVGQALDALKQHHVEQVVMAGGIKRPSLKDLYPDAMGRKLLRALGGSLIAGDDKLLSKVICFLEDHGLSVVAADDICKDLLASKGVMTQVTLSTQHIEDRDKGIAILQTLSPHDVGQAIMLHHGHVLGIEALEGTAALIERCAGLRTDSEGGVLVKMPKQGQERRADLPAVGLETVRNLKEYGFSGMCIAANETLMLAKYSIIKQADDMGLFIEGFTVNA